MNPLSHGVPDDSLDDSLADLVEEYASRVQAGDAIDLEELVRANPEHEARLRRLLGTVAALADLRRPAPTTADLLVGRLRSCSDREGTVFGDFRLEREIGRGGMGVVYEAEQLSLHRRVALKVLPLAATLDPRQLQRFHNEAQAAARLNHGHIVSVFTVGCEQDVHYYVMQLIEGRTVAALIKERTLPADAAARLMMQAAEALDYAHQVGVVHRDIKPANLLVDNAGKLWVTDFGLAQFQEMPEVTQTGDLVGTLRYMSPEQTLGQRGGVDHRTDIYALGVTLYELLTLRPAFAAGIAGLCCAR